MNDPVLGCPAYDDFQQSRVVLGLSLLVMAIATLTPTVAQTSRDFALERDAVLALSGGRGGAAESEVQAISYLKVVHQFHGEYLRSTRLAVDRLLEIAHEDLRPGVVADALGVLAHFRCSAFDDPTRSRRAVGVLGRGFGVLEPLRLVTRLAQVEGAQSALRRAVDGVFDRSGAEVGRIAALETLIGARRWAARAVLEDLIDRHRDDAAGLREVLIVALARECGIEGGIPELDGAAGRRLHHVRRYLLTLGGDHGGPGVGRGLGDAAQTGDLGAMLTLAAAERRGAFRERFALQLIGGVDTVLQRAEDGRLDGDRQAIAAALVVVARRVRTTAAPQWISEACSRIEQQLLTTRADLSRTEDVFLRIALQELQDWVTKRERCSSELVQWSCILRYYELYEDRRAESLAQAREWYLGRFGWDELAAVPDRDPWGGEYVLEERMDRTRAVVSGGSDGIRRTGDDDAVYVFDGK